MKNQNVLPSASIWGSDYGYFEVIDDNTDELISVECSFSEAMIKREIHENDKSYPALYSMFEFDLWRRK